MRLRGTSYPGQISCQGGTLTRRPYSFAYEPAAPTIPVRISSPAGPSLEITALVDTGSDVTVLEESIPGRLGLPAVGPAILRFAGGPALPAQLHAAAFELEGLKILLDAPAFGEETLLGRDLLNNLVLRLDGPGLFLDVGT